MESIFERLLVVGAHIDDPEFLAGGTLSRFGARAKVTVMGVADVKHLDEDYDRNVSMEYGRAMSILGVENYDLPETLLRSSRPGVESYLFNRDGIQKQLKDAWKEFNPTVVVTHQSGDTHQDHAVVRDEVVRYFKSRCPILLGYQPWNDLEFPRRHFFVELSAHDMGIKLEALNQYQSQMKNMRGYFDEECQLAQAKLAGGMIGCLYAEAFEVVRLWAKIK